MTSIVDQVVNKHRVHRSGNRWECRCGWFATSSFNGTGTAHVAEATVIAIRADIASLLETAATLADAAYPGNGLPYRIAADIARNAGEA